MIKGVHITLLMGPVVAVPVPAAVMNALVGIEVQNNTDSQSGFQLTFKFSSKSILNTVLLLLGNIGPVVRTIIVATHNGMPQVLMDGVVTRQQVAPDVQSGSTTLTLHGRDLTELMDQIEFRGIPYPGMPPSARVLTILAKYAAFGIIPLVIPSVMLDVPIPTDRIPTQNAKDLPYIKGLADEVGYIFYVDPGPAPGTSTAYWGPEIKVGLPQPALSVNMDAHTNVEALSVSYDGSSKTLHVLMVHNKETKITIPIPLPDINPLSPPLGAISGIPSNVVQVENVAKLSPIKAAMIGMAKAAKTADNVSLTGSLDVMRYGQILKSRQLVGVRGTGIAFDGLYFVKSVTHKIKRGEYKQDFTLSRNGLVSTVPAVPV